MATAAISALGAGHYLDWGVLSISIANLAIILVMIAVFGLALLLPFPRPRSSPEEDRGERS